MEVAHFLFVGFWRLLPRIFTTNHRPSLNGGGGLKNLPSLFMVEVCHVFKYNIGREICLKFTLMKTEYL